MISDYMGAAKAGQRELPNHGPAVYFSWFLLLSVVPIFTAGISGVNGL